MKNKIELLSVLAVFALFAVIAVPSVSATYPANSVYFEPEDSSAQFCDNTYVQIMVNARVDTTCAGMDIYFDPSCVNITDVDFTGSSYYTPGLTGWSHWGDHIRLGGMGWAEPGIHLIANLTLHCENEAYCTSDLLFAETELLDYDGDPLLDVTWHDGTFTCESHGKPDLVVEKSVEAGADGNFVVSYTVTNIGGGDAGPSTTCKYVDGVLQESQPCPALAPEASHSDAFEPEECPCGETLNVTVCADNDDVVVESDETNNCEVKIVECPYIPTPPIEVDLRADGIASNIFNVAGYMICPGTVTEDGVTINNETAMGALVIYCQNNGINIHITMGTLGEYVVQIGNDPADNNSWSYAVNEEVPPVGGAQKVIVDGDRVHWYNYNLNYYSMLTSIDKTEIVVGETLTATVTWKDITGTHLLNGASVHVGAMGPWGPEPGPSVGTTGVDGTCTFSWSTVGTWGVYAVDPVHGTGIYNYPSVSFTCSTEEKPDLVVSDKWETVEDGKVIVHFEIHNSGTVKAGESYATLYIDNMVVETQNVLVEALGPNGRFVSEFAAEDCTPGTITVKVCADDTHVVDESNENNNCMTNYFTCPAAKEPDLDVIEMWEEPVRVDGHVIVHFVVKNIGDAEAGESYATLYIDDMVVETQNVLVPELGPNGRFVSEFAPEDWTPGTAITVKVCADDTHVVDESVETNNCEQHQYTCQTWPEPDLIVLSMSEEPVAGQVIVHFVIQNVGQADAGLSTACLEINGVMIDTASVPVLQPGISYGGAFAAQDCPPSETITITVCADNDDVVDESNENNNCLVNQYTCPIRPKPDLVVSDKYETFDEDGMVIVHFEIHNSGTANAGASFATKYMYIGGVLEEKHNAFVPVIAPNGKFNGAFEPENCPPGVNITVRVCADDTHVVDESVETNNCEQHQYTCPVLGKPDLVVIEMSEEPVKTDGQVIVHFEIHNQGTADAGASFATKYLYIGGVLVEKHNAPVPELGPNGKFNGEFEPEDCTPGTTITVKVCADDTNVVDESDEGNNCMTNYFIPPSAPGPDLVITDIWENDGTIWFKIENRGTEEAGSSYTALYVNGAYQARKKVGSLDSGETKELYFRYVYTPVTDDILKVCADSGNDVAESNEGNNCKELIPGGKPDLNVSEITLNCGGYLFASESNEICAKIENIGGGGAGAFNVRFDIDGFSTEVRISGLAAGANTTVCINDTTIRNAGDSVTITVTADCDGEVSESDETNNVLALAKTVVNNGYKGKRYTGGEDINTWKTFELNGNLIYSLGDSYYLSSYSDPDWTEYNAGWDASELPIPGTATIETARLFVPYTWDKAGVMPAYAAMSFNGKSQTLDAYYSDEKGWGTSYPYGMLVYDVTADFDTSGNVATLTNSCPGGGGVSMRGMLLVVVYADASEPERTILMNEEFDLLYGGASKCTTPEEATAYAPFGSIDTTGVQQATLITVAPGAGPDEGDLGFNGHMWYDAWNFVGPGTPTPQIGIAETDVTTYLQAADNEAYFQSSADYMEASNAFLILEKEEEPTPPPGPDLVITDIWENDGTIWFKIENRGTEEAGSSYTALYVNGAYQARKKVGSLDSGETKELYFRYVYMPGTDDIVKICADSGNDVAESNETNNCRTVIWECDRRS